jgi:PAS domain S-box-containing protein
MLDADAAEVRAPWQEQPTMEATLSQQRILPAIAAFAVGIAVSSLLHTPFGLLAPIVALFLFASGRTGLLLHVASATGLVGSLLVAAFCQGQARDFATMWAAFFALAICIGALVATRMSASHSAEAGPAAIPTTTLDEAPSYPAIGPTLHEKAAPRHSPFVGISAEDDTISAALLAAASFWGGTPFHMRYWQRRLDGSNRWVESRSEPLREPSGTRQWSSVSADIDDQRPAHEPPTRIASNPPSDDDAVRAAKFVEKLLGNAWAFDAAGRPTYLTPIGQTLVAATLEEFQAAVDEGHTFFKRTAHPDDYARISAAWRHSLQTGDPFFLDRRIRRASGIHEWNRTGFVPTRDRQGRITGWYGATIDLDSHRIAEAELRERERELSQLVNMVPVHIRRMTPQGEPTFVNKRLLDFIGLGDVADLDKPGMSRLAAIIQSLVHPDDASSLLETARHCFAAGEPFSMKYRMRRADGAYCWVDTRSEPLRDEGGAIAQWYVVSLDIDDEMRAQETVRNREAELSQLVDMVPSLLWRSNPNGGPNYFNKRMIDFLGLDTADYGKPGMSRLAAALAASIHPDDAAGVTEGLDHSLVTGEPFSMAYRLRRADGVYRWVSGRAEPMRDESGRIIQWYGLAHDIDDQMRAEAAIRQSERRLQQMIDAVPVYILSFTASGEPIYVNKRYQDYLGFSVPSFGSLEEQLGAIIHPDDFAEVHRTLSNCFQTGEPFLMRFRRCGKDGVYLWTEGRAEPLRDQDGRIVQWYGVSLDIEDERRAQEALRQASDKLAQATQAASLAELSASIAHEVNQPLAAIVANSYACQRWLSAEPPNVERAKITVERVIRDANSAADVVSRIRALFKQSVGTRTSAVLPDVLTEARNLMAEEAARRRVRMDVNVEDNLPLVAFDRVQLQQVLINLIRNGMDAMDSIAGDRILVMRVRRLGDVVRTEISDRGCGVEFPDRIFQPFFTTKQNGMGMGLAICRTIVESHGGRLWAEENKPHGATFIFTLPIEEKAAP